MKHVIKKHLVPANTIESGAARPDQFYLTVDEEITRRRALTLKDVAFLRVEPEGYIFRKIGGIGGHSGHSDSIGKAIDRALNVGEWAVYEFDTMGEALRYLLQDRRIKL